MHRISGNHSTNRPHFSLSLTADTGNFNISILILKQRNKNVYLQVTFSTMLHKKRH